MKSTSLLAVALILTSGCLTPKPIKQVSKDIKSGVSVYTSTVNRDLEATEKFIEDAGDALNAERGRVSQSLEAARELAELALDAKLNAARTNLLLRFESKAYQIMTVEFRGAVEARLVPLIQPQIERLRERERVTRAASEADPRSALATREYMARVIEHNALLVKAKNIELECYKLMQQELDQARLEYSELVNSELDAVRSRHKLQASRDFAAIIESLKAAPPASTAYSAVVSNIVQQLQDHRNVMSAFATTNAAAVEELDRFIQSNGYLNLFVSAYVKGVWKGIADTMPLVKAKINDLKLPGFVTETLQNSLDRLKAKGDGISADVDSFIVKKIEPKLSEIQDKVMNKVGAKLGEAVKGGANS